MQIEQEAGLEHRPDLRVSSARDADSYLEVYVAHPKADNDHQWCRWASDTDPWARQKWSERLQSSYRNNVRPSFSVELIPAVVNTYGAWHPSSIAWAQHQIQAYVDGKNIPGLGERQMRTVTARFVSHLSVTVQRAVAGVPHSTLPQEMHPDEGTLSHPLSEEPEVWRRLAAI